VKEECAFFPGDKAEGSPKIRGGSELDELFSLASASAGNDKAVGHTRDRDDLVFPG
jgi:hypothetical protein